MRRSAFMLVAVGMVGAALALVAPASGHTDGEAAPIFVTTIPPGYRDWTLISVAREEGSLDDIRAVLGNDAAIKTYREGQLPFPDGSIIARIAWSYDALAPASCGHPQSFVAGPPKNGVQFMVKDSRKYASTAANLPTRRCSKPARDSVFTHYAP